MDVISQAAVEAIYWSLSKDFHDALAMRKPWFQQVASELQSTGARNIYSWAKQIPRLREWVGPRVANNLSTLGYALDNKDFEGTIVVGRNSILDDQLATHSLEAKQLGQQAALWPDDLIGDAILNGGTELCYDGQPFFDDSHPVDVDDASKGTFDNNLGLALDITNFTTARAAMRAFKGPDGKSLRIKPNLLVVPPSLEAKALQVAKAENIAPSGGFGMNAAQSQTNVMKLMCDVLVIDDLESDPTAWYLLDTTQVIKPFIFQNRQAPKLVALTDPSSPEMFNKKQFVFGVDCRGNAGYSLPCLAIKSKP